MEVWWSENDTLFFKLIQTVWDTETAPQGWKDPSIIPLFKKVDRKKCGSYRAYPFYLL